MQLEEVRRKLRRNLAMNAKHAQACHERWLKRRNRKHEEGYQDEWYGEQCGACRYFVPLTGAFIEDWGVCTNATSPFDGRAMFEHDGCEHFEEAQDAWGRVFPTGMEEPPEQA